MHKIAEIWRNYMMRIKWDGMNDENKSAGAGNISTYLSNSEP